MIKINNIDCPESFLNQLVADILKKKELAAIDTSFVFKRLILVLEKNYRLAAKWNHMTNRSADYKRIVKLVRDDLRKSYGLFRIKPGVSQNRPIISLVKKFKPLVDNWENNHYNDSLLIKILQQHASTKERLPYYGQLYRRLFAITGNPQTILDLGCGLNPFSLPFMGLDPGLGLDRGSGQSIHQLSYYAYDLNSSEIEAINLFFKMMKVSGKAQIGDLTQTLKLPSADIAFLFKITDILDHGRGHKKTEQVLKQIPAKYVIISFATLTISNRPMRAPRRRWVEWLCQRLGYSYKIIEIPNEIFYVIKKSQGTE